MAAPVDPNHWSNHVDPDRPESWPPSSDVPFHNVGGQLLADQQGVPLRIAKTSDQFHQRGRHVQHAHGRRAEKLAADGDHLSGAMIALMPTEADAKRLAIKGGEKAADLHVTLFYLGKGDDFGHDDRNNIVTAVRSYISEVPGPITAKIFGAAHWNGNGDQPSWVWSVGDEPEGDVELNLMHTIAVMALESMHEHPELPMQHSPWVPHICAAYTDDLSLIGELEKRLGTVEFDRVRVTFGGDATDISLGEAITASGILRRKPRDFEASVDFEAFQEDWEKAVDSAMSGLDKITAKWRASIRDQVETALAKDQPEALTGMTLSTIDARVMIEKQMIALAQEAGERVQKEAEDQGVEIPEWDIGNLTAALAGRDLLKSVARMTADALSGSVVASAKRRVTQLLGLAKSPEAAAQDVDEHLADMSDAGPRATLGTAMTTAQNTGRRAVMEAAPEATYYASEILDKNTCGPCREIDGEEYSSLGVAIKHYPVSGYRDCVGSKYGNNCRGMIIARWPRQVSVGSAAAEEFHGHLGDPGYHSLHPGNRGKGLRRLGPPRGGMVGSPSFTEEEHIAALESYVDAPDVNLWLRKGRVSSAREEEEVKTEAKTIDDLIQIQDPLPEANTSLLRGGSKLPAMKPGDEFTDAGFGSATTNPDVADLFAMAPLMRGEGSKGDTLHITAPAGARVLEVYSVYAHGNEDEWIFPPGTTYLVTAVTEDGYEVEVVVR